MESKNAEIVHPVLTGATASRMMLDALCHPNIRINIAQTSPPHYNPTHTFIVLPHTDYYGTHMHSIATACHETGHAIQHATKNRLFMARLIIYPWVNILLPMALVFILLSLCLSIYYMLAVMLIWCVFSFYGYCTLKIEEDATQRALAWMRSSYQFTFNQLDEAESFLNSNYRSYSKQLFPGLWI